MVTLTTTVPYYKMFVVTVVIMIIMIIIYNVCLSHGITPWYDSILTSISTQHTNYTTNNILVVTIVNWGNKEMTSNVVMDDKTRL